MLGILTGILLSIGFVSLLNLLKSRNTKLNWWKWILIVSWFLYTAFLIMMIESFILEGAPKAALIMGLVFGFIAILWAILAFRFIIKIKIQKS